jgi:Holliday junction DNA helicase RuvA
MIGKLTGVVDSRGEDCVILDVNGVGYVVHCSPRTLQSLPRCGEPAALSIETQLRDDSLRLYGFPSEAERDWFRLLQSVQGVGAKVALAIEGALGAGALSAAVAAQDKAALARAPGVGPKLAARIVAELKDKALPACTLGPVTASQGGSAEGGPTPPAVEDAITVLVNLGYGRAQAAAAVATSAADLGDGAGSAELIRRGLKELAR